MRVHESKRRGRKVGRDAGQGHMQQYISGSGYEVQVQVREMMHLPACLPGLLLLLLLLVLVLLMEQVRRSPLPLSH